MAVKVQKPKAGAKIALPKRQPEKNLERTGTDEMVPLQVQMTEADRREVKAYASLNGLTVSKLFQKMWSFYQDNH